MQRTTRNAELSDLAEMLKHQHARKLDMIVPASKLSSDDADLVVDGAEPVIDDDGVTPADGVYVPTAVCDGQIAEKLGIPVAYLKRLRSERTDLFDANVNGWLHGDDERQISADPRKFMLRTFKPDNDTDHVLTSNGARAFCSCGANSGSAESDLFNAWHSEHVERFGGTGIARALLSDRYDIVDNLDVLMSALQGVRDAGVTAHVSSCDLTDRKMFVRIVAPEVQALAPTLLKGYRSPFDNGGVRAGARANMLGAPGHEYREDVVFAGFEISNSETGGGAFTITPRLVVQICDNGLTITKDALSKVHVGGKLDEGVIRWSHETQRKSLELVVAQTRDAVSTFLDVEYVTSVIERIESDAARPVSKPDELVKTIGKTLRYSDAEIDGVLDHFIRGGQMTAGGVLNAVTSYAQCIDDADDAHELEASAMRAFDLAR